MTIGLKLTFKHLWHAGKRRKPESVESDNYFEQQNGLVTTLYPHETIPVPDNGRYRLHNEIDDCIVCDLCAKICPVDCIDIEAIKSSEEIGKTSDGSSKRLYAATFDIDMAKCCYCGLCTTVCPTECLTMTKTYDFSEFNVWDMNYHFANLSPEEAEEKKKIYEESQRLKAELKKQQAAEKAQLDKPAGFSKPKIAGKPAIKPIEKEKGSSESREESLEKQAGAKPKFKPVIKPSGIKKKEQENERGVGRGESEEKSLEKGDESLESKELKQSEESKPNPSVNKPKPNIKPIIKPVVKKKEEGKEEKSGELKNSEEPKPNPSADKPKPKIKPIIKPVIKPKKKDNDEDNESN